VGVRKEYRLLVDAYVATHSNRHTVAAPGLTGGGEGATTSIVHNPGSEGAAELPREGTFIPVAGQDVVTIVSGGGGGFGDPLDRPSDLVLRDVLNGKVTPDGARQGYGVVVEAEGDGPRLDREATELLRREMRAARG
jgi:N-methylhydantoinase B